VQDERDCIKFDIPKFGFLINYLENISDRSDKYLQAMCKISTSPRSSPRSALWRYFC